MRDVVQAPQARCAAGRRAPVVPVARPGRACVAEVRLATARRNRSPWRAWARPWPAARSQSRCSGQLLRRCASVDAGAGSHRSAAASLRRPGRGRALHAEAPGNRVRQRGCRRHSAHAPRGQRGSPSRCRATYYNTDGTPWKGGTLKRRRGADRALRHRLARERARCPAGRPAAGRPGDREPQPERRPSNGPTISVDGIALSRPRQPGDPGARGIPRRPLRGGGEALVWQWPSCSTWCAR